MEIPDVGVDEFATGLPDEAKFHVRRSHLEKTEKRPRAKHREENLNDKRKMMVSHDTVTALQGRIHRNQARRKGQQFSIAQIETFLLGGYRHLQHLHHLHWSRTLQIQRIKEVTTEQRKSLTGGGGEGGGGGGK